MTRKSLVIADPELVKNITVKDFDHFTDHMGFSANDKKIKNLFILKGDEWRDLRATLSPSFTANKLRIMLELMEKCAKNIENFLIQEHKKTSNEVLHFETKALFSRFANDAIATAAFGIEIDSIRNPNNEFFLMGQDFTNLTKNFRWLKIPISMISPKLLEFFCSESIFPEVSAKFFKNLFLENIKFRRKENIVRPDLIHLMMEASKTKDLSDENMMDQSLLFFLAGFDTVSTSLSILMHHLAQFQEIQEKLCQEIDKCIEKYGENLNYDILMYEMSYMDMVFQESQRMQPVAVLLDRVCVKKYSFPAQGTRPEVTIEPGQHLIIPIYSFHHDPDYFPDPMRFDPERFLSENKHKISQYTFMPFGVGPRNCIANRFAKLEMKLATYYILKKFNVVFTKETQHPMEFKTSGLALTSKNGFHLGFKYRK